MKNFPHDKRKSEKLLQYFSFFIGKVEQNKDLKDETIESRQVDGIPKDVTQFRLNMSFDSVGNFDVCLIAVIVCIFSSMSHCFTQSNILNDLNNKKYENRENQTHYGIVITDILINRISNSLMNNLQE